MRTSAFMHSDNGRTLEDIDLAASIAAALHIDLGAPEITIDASHGAVRLEGHAESEQQRRSAEAIARRFSPNITNAVIVKRFA